MSIQTDFYNRYAAAAARASAATGIPAQTILAQWALESGHGRSDLAKTGHNLAGIRKDGRFRKYASVDEFTTDYIRAASLPRYAAAKTTSAEAAAAALGAGGWDEAQYRGAANQAGERVINVLRQDRATITSALGATPKKKTDDAPSGWDALLEFGRNPVAGAVIAGEAVTGSGGLSDLPVIGGAVGAAQDGIQAVGRVADALTSPDLWKRVGIGALGVLLLILAFGGLMKDEAVQVLQVLQTTKGVRP